MRRALALLLSAMSIVVLTACESTEQESAKIGRESAAGERAALAASHHSSRERAHSPSPASSVRIGAKHAHTSSAP